MPGVIQQPTRNGHQDHARQHADAASPFLTLFVTPGNMTVKDHAKQEQRGHRKKAMDFHHGQTPGTPVDRQGPRIFEPVGKDRPQTGHC